MLLELWCKFGFRLLNDLCRHGSATRGGLPVSIKMNLLLSRSIALCDPEAYIFSSAHGKRTQWCNRWHALLSNKSYRDLWWSKFITFNIWMSPTFPTPVLLKSILALLTQFLLLLHYLKKVLPFWPFFFFPGFCWWLIGKKEKGIELRLGEVPFKECLEKKLVWKSQEAWKKYKENKMTLRNIYNIGYMSVSQCLKILVRDCIILKSQLVAWVFCGTQAPL